MPVTTARALLWAAGLTVMSVRTSIFALAVTMPRNTQTGNTRMGCAISSVLTMWDLTLSNMSLTSQKQS